MNKLRNKLCVLALAALLLNLLAACRASSPAENSGGPEDASDKPSQSQTVRGTEGPGTSEEPSPEPTPEPDLWDPEHRLDISFTPAKGLELPVSGATGYATVKLPLWEELPEEEEGKLATIYAPPEPSPEPSEEPDQEPEPEDMPEPPVETEPVPEEPPEGAGPAAEESPGQGEAEAEPTAQAETAEPAADSADPPEEAVENGLEPEPFITIEPSGEPAGEPAPDAPDIDANTAQEPVPEDTPEPAPETTPETSPEPSPEPSEEPDPMEDALLVLEPGTAFTILGESGDWWEVKAEGETGWVEHRYCLINLPDVVPSIIYNDTNSYSSVFVSSGKTIPNITGKPLYHAEDYNPRLGYNEFMMPVLYTMAKNVAQAQQNALAEGNTLVIYEAYRPYTAQMAVVRNLSALAQKDSEVKAGIATAPWNISWFIATGSSNHQEGYAMDVSLAKVTKAHVGSIYGYNVVQVDEYEEYNMPTPIHELSMAAATYTKPVAIFSTTAWRYAEMSPAMAANEPAKALQRYCTEAKLTPLASEWWHFNDLAAYSQIRTYHSTGEFEITVCLSTAP